MSFLDRLNSQDLIWGPFFNTPSVTLCEAAARMDCDCVCLDAEHGVFDRKDIDLGVLALKSANRASIVRISHNSPHLVGAALDAGADAILVPHIRNVQEAKSLAKSARYETGRGFSGGVRAAGFGAKSLADQLHSEDKRVAVIAQIEDADALDHAEAICATPGIDSIFIGRSDLTVSMGHTDRNHPDVIAAVEHVAEIAVSCGKTVGTFLTDPADIPHWRKRGIHFFLMGSLTGFAVSGANALAKQIRAT